MMRLTEKLIALRERLNRSPHDIAEEIGVTSPCYYDLESYDDELATTLDLDQVERLCALLGCKIRSLILEDEPTEMGKECFNFPPIVAQIQACLTRHQILVEEFESRCGWEIRDALLDPAAARKWNLVCLRDVGKTLGLPWKKFLDEIVVAG